MNISFRTLSISLVSQKRQKYPHFYPSRGDLSLRRIKGRVFGSPDIWNVTISMKLNSLSGKTEFLRFSKCGLADNSNPVGKSKSITGQDVSLGLVLSAWCWILSSGHRS